MPRGSLHERREAKLHKMRVKDHCAGFVGLDGPGLGRQADSPVLALLPNVLLP
jgi:hypothetical protein